MKRDVVEILKRGFDSALANWQLIAIHVGAAFVMVMVTILGALAMLVPILVSVGVKLASLKSPEQWSGLLQGLVTKWMLLVWLAVGVTILLTIVTAIYAATAAGAARIFADAERAAGPGAIGPRSRFAAFRMDRWISGVKEGWWPVFWMYNIAWAAALVIVLIPLLATGLLMFLFRNVEPALVGIGCIGVLIALLLFFLLAIATGIVLMRAIAEWAVRGEGARGSLANAWQAVRRDFARHVLVALALIVISIALSSAFASVNFFSGMMQGMGRQAPMLALVLLPLRLVMSIVSTIFSAAVTSWYQASFTALAVEDRG
ncbi:MAG TPA: hypothetical protein VF824_15315 [Thermoanaerobaculia bacterium]